MKILSPLTIIVTAALLLASCQRELFFDGMSTGYLKKDQLGNCLPIRINGVYNIDSSFNTNNFIEVQAEVTYPGNYDITSDTVNGYFFHQSGKVERGTNTIRLMATGKPLVAGTDCFTVKYGASTCNLCVKALGPSPAEYSLAGAPNSCTGIFADGSYVVGKSLGASNILRVQAIVTKTGNYTINATTTNGFSFSRSDVFITTGLQDVYLRGTGTPVNAGVSAVFVNGINSTCNTGITVLSDTEGKAVFSFDGSPGSCINFTINGNYYAGITTTAVNTIAMSVNVTKPGAYTINTNTANGITFSDAGAFTNTGPHTVILTARGTPFRTETTSFIPNTGTVSCNFDLNVAPLPPPAAFTLSGAPNACAPVTVNGFYILLKPLDAANSVTIQVDVSTPGSYSVSTSTVNGMSFSASGVFTATGLQNIVLHGSGIPQATGVSVFTPHAGTSTCNFSVTVQ